MLKFDFVSPKILSVVYQHQKIEDCNIINTGWKYIPTAANRILSGAEEQILSWVR